MLSLVVPTYKQLLRTNCCIATMHMRCRFLGLDPGVGRSDIRRANTREQHLEAKGQLAKGEKVRLFDQGQSR